MLTVTPDVGWLAAGIVSSTSESESAFTKALRTAISARGNLDGISSMQAVDDSNCRSSISDCNNASNSARIGKGILRQNLLDRQCMVCVPRLFEPRANLMNLDQFVAGQDRHRLDSFHDENFITRSETDDVSARGLSFHLTIVLATLRE